jgi:hypothetical protein
MKENKRYIEITVLFILVLLLLISLVIPIWIAFLSGTGQITFSLVSGFGQVEMIGDVVIFTAAVLLGIVVLIFLIHGDNIK